METNHNPNQGEKNTNQPLNKMNENSVFPANSDGVHDKHLDNPELNHTAIPNLNSSPENHQNKENRDIKNNESSNNQPADEQMFENNEDELEHDDKIDNDIETYNDQNSIPSKRSDNLNEFTDINNFRL